MVRQTHLSAQVDAGGAPGQDPIRETEHADHDAPSGSAKGHLGILKGAPAHPVEPPPAPEAWRGHEHTVFAPTHDHDHDGGCGGHDGLPHDGFIAFVESVLQHPAAATVLAAGENAADAAHSTLFWTYDLTTGLHVEALPGYLVTGHGDGGFTLDVHTDGSWELDFSGSNQKIGYGFHAGWMDHGPSAALNEPPGAPPAGNSTVLIGDGGSFYDGSAGQENIIAGAGRDILIGGPGDYMDGGAGLNCAYYTSGGSLSVLVDLEHGHGYGSNAEGDSYVNMQQTRGSPFSNVLIGNHDGSDLKSGGGNSLLISTGGVGELRPDGPDNVLVSTVGAGHVVFDPAHGWVLGDAETMLGFNAAHGDLIDVTAAQHGWVDGQSQIADYVKLVDESDGTHVMFNPDGQVTTAGVELIDLKLTHGLDLHQLYADHSILI